MTICFLLLYGCTGVSMGLSENDFGYEITVQFPGTAGDMPALLDSLEALSMQTVDDFLASLQFLQKGDPTWRLSLVFSHEPSPRGLVCILATEYAYWGGAHGLESFSALVYQPEGSVFIEPQSLLEDFPAFARAVRDTLLKDPLADREWIALGTEPVPGNYRALLPFPDSTGAFWGFQVVLPAYQVAPYSAGVHRVMIPIQ